MHLDEAMAAVVRAANTFDEAEAYLYSATRGEKGAAQSRWEEARGRLCAAARTLRDRQPCTLDTCGHMRQLDAIVDFLGMARGTRSVLDELRSRTSALESAARDCGVDVNNPDTCGVCHKHFAECEEDQNCVGDETDTNDIPIGREPACPGARVRAALHIEPIEKP